MFEKNVGALCLASTFLFGAKTPDDVAINCDPGLVEASFPSVIEQRGKDVEPIVLKVDPKTRTIIGPMVRPRGELIDLRDMPGEVGNRVAILAEGLSGIEQTLTVQFCRNLTLVAEQGNLPKPYSPVCEAIRDNWNEHLSQLVRGLDPKTPGSMSAAALYYDTGRRFSVDQTEIKVISAPKIALVESETTSLLDLMGLEIAISRLGPDLPAEEAKALYELIKEIAGETRDISDPWFHHAHAQVLFLSMGKYNEGLVKNNPFKISVDQFFKNCRDALMNELVDAHVPALPGNKENGILYFYEGYAVVQAVSTEEQEAGWDVPQELIDFNSSTHHPVLLVQVPESSKYDGVKVKTAQISLIVGGEKRTLYEGPLPLK